MPRVAIIPGHGGFDPGAVNNSNGTRECDGNLAVAMKLKELLEFNNFQVSVSRTTDEACGGAMTVSQDVSNQIKFAIDSGADVAVAIHFNSSSSKAAHGTEILYTANGFFDGEKVRLAACILNHIVAAAGLGSRGIKNTPVGVSLIRKVTSMPIVLSECAFVSNDEESVWCSDPERRMILARAHARAICEYFGKDYVDMDITKIKVNGVQISYGYLINNFNYAPVRALAEALGATVNWDAAGKTVNITKKS